MLSGIAAFPALAQEEVVEPPLSVIDWLEEVPAELPPDQALLSETPVVDSGIAPTVEAQPLDGADAPSVGVVGPAASGLPASLWQGARGAEIARAFNALPDEALAPVATLRTGLLLASAAAPVGVESERFLLERVQRLRALGQAGQALALLEAAEPLTPALFAEYADLSLITNRDEAACAMLADTPALSSDLSFRVFCLARGSDWNAAALALQTGEVLGDIPPAKAELLAQFLEPELVTGPPRDLADMPITPLVVRLREAIGYPLSTASLPRVFAQADLRPEMGWKAQLEAAERLALTGAAPANQLFGLYTERQPAASGGVWDRAATLQALDAALATGTPRAINRALPDAYAEMAEIGLLPTLAAMVAPALDPGMELSRTATPQRDNLLLLSDRYERTGPTASPLARAIAAGDVTGITAPTGSLEAALYAGFAQIPAAPGGPLGITILRALADIEAARNGDYSRVSAAIGKLRALGLESTARQAALHLLVLA